MSPSEKDPARAARRSTRLRDWDYSSPGAYFVTICAKGRACLFGDVISDNMIVNEIGEIVYEEWVKAESVRNLVRINVEEFVVMPNHVHGIIWIDRRTPGSVGATRRVAPTPARGPIPGSIGAIVGQFKSITTKRINRLLGTPGSRIWQRGFYDHVIRDEVDLRRVREYIIHNPLRWALDPYHPRRNP